MANPSLTWTLNRERGTISFGRLLPLTGNTYNLTIAGGATGESYTFYVMDESGEVCLARSETANGVTTIAFNSEALRKQFVKDWHEVCVFHCVCSNGTATIAESDLSVTWNPVWTDVESGSAYSMRGPQGVGISAVEYASTDDDGNITYQFRLTNGSVTSFVAPRGPRGPVTDLGYVKDEDGDNKWHKVIVRTNRFGEKTIDIEQTGVDTRPDSSDVVTIGGVQTITGKKHFKYAISTLNGVEYYDSFNLSGGHINDSGHFVIAKASNGDESWLKLHSEPSGDLAWSILGVKKNGNTITKETEFILPTNKGSTETIVVKSDFSNIVGNLTGNVTGGTISGTSVTSSGNITATGNVTAPNFIGNVTGTADNQAVTDYSGNVANTKFVKDYCDTNQAKKDFSDVSEATMRKVAFPKWDEDHITIDYALSVPIGTHEFTIEHDCDLMLTIIGNSSTASVVQLLVNNFLIGYLRTTTSVYANSTLRLRAGDVVSMNISGAVVNTIHKAFVRYDR